MGEPLTSVTLQKKIVTTQGPKLFFFRKKNLKKWMVANLDQGRQCHWNWFEDSGGGDTRSMYPKSEF